MSWRTTGGGPARQPQGLAFCLEEALRRHGKPEIFNTDRQITHGRRRRLIISHQHAEAGRVERACRNLAPFLHGLRRTAEQLTSTERWYRILSRAMRTYLHGRQLKPPDPLPAPA